jgi:hypothetical protein
MDAVIIRSPTQLIAGLGAASPGSAERFTEPSSRRRAS